MNMVFRCIQRGVNSRVLHPLYVSCTVTLLLDVSILYAATENIPTKKTNELLSSL